MTLNFSQLCLRSLRRQIAFVGQQLQEGRHGERRVGVRLGDEAVAGGGNANAGHAMGSPERQVVDRAATRAATTSRQASVSHALGQAPGAGQGRSDGARAR
jgi:hypothetical protein